MVGKDKNKMMYHGAPMGMFFVAWFGALVFFVNHANGFGEVLLAFLKSLVWPAILLYYALQALGAA